MLSSVTVMRAPAGPDTTDAGAPGATWPGAPARGGCPGPAGGPPPGGGTTGAEAGATCPNGTRRNTMFTPCPDGSFSAACSRRNSIASRMVVSRNSMCGMMMLFSLLVICAVQRVSIPRPLLYADGTTEPYLITGYFHDSTTFIG